VRAAVEPASAPRAAAAAAARSTLDQYLRRGAKGHP
jgi:hypothetical protein